MYVVLSMCAEEVFINEADHFTYPYSHLLNSVMWSFVLMWQTPRPVWLFTAPPSSAFSIVSTNIFLLFMFMACVCSASEAAAGGGCCLSGALLHGRSCSENKDDLHAFVKVSWSAERCGVKHGVIWCDVLRWDDVCCVVWCGEQRSLLSRRRGGHAYKITNSCSDAGSCLAQPQEQQGEV